MRFELDAEQADLAALARRFFTDALPDDQAATLAGRAEPDRKAWARMAEAGFPSIAVPAEHDGAGGTWLDLAVVLEAAGQAVSSQPLLATAGAAVAALRAAGPGAQAALAAIASAEITATWVDARRPASGVTATAGRGGWSLTGECSHVPHGDSADLLVVAASTGGGLGLFTLERGSASVTGETPLDPSRSLATVVLDGVKATAVATELDEAALLRAQAITRILQAAEQVGVGQGALDLAVDHALTRQQFGRPIGGFQAIKHLLADAYAEVDSARVVARYGAWAISTADPVDPAADPLDLAALTAAHVSPAIERAAAAALQVLGGIGYTWEHPGHLYYKRALSSARLLGHTDGHLDRIADGFGLGADARP
ncbi:acyl-CoA dehydrogenase family protein [Spirillospora sp. CA-255316]